MTDLQLAIAPAYQRQGLGKKFMLHVIEVAKEQGLNIAITADAGMYLALCQPPSSRAHPLWYTRKAAFLRNAWVSSDWRANHDRSG